MAEEVYRYRAFVSYRHKDLDRKWARWLIEKLETYRTPRALVKNGAPARIGRLFRDDDEIPASSDLGHQIEDALKDSQFLIVVCSRDTPESKWVAREVETFCALGKGSHIFALLVDGEPDEAFPERLLRVPEERTLPDGTRTTVLVDAEPIAADVRPRTDERPSQTERRAFLRIAAGLLGVGYDDLVQREHQRRLKQQRIQGAIASAAVLAVAAGAYRYWDYDLPHTHDYANYTTRWGVPEGVGALSANTAAHRNVSYAITTQYGHVVEMRRENGSHGLVALAGNGIDGETWDAGVADWKIAYEGDRVGTIVLSGAGGRTIRTETYQFLEGGHSAVVAFTNAKGGAMGLAAGSLDLGAALEAGASTGRSQITQFRLVFAADGTIAQRLNQTPWGSPARDSSGSFGRRYSYFPNGLVKTSGDLDADGRVLADLSGVSSLIYSYSPGGDLAQIVWQDSKGAPVFNSSGFARLRRRQDGYGNAIESDFFGADGKPVLREKDGAARVAWKYDDRGNQIENDFFGTDGQPILSRDYGAARVTMKYDARGNLIEGDFFGIDGKPILRWNWGVARVTDKTDAHGHLIEQTYFDARGRLALRRDWGVARATAKYDKHGRLVEQDFFGTDGKLVLRKDWGVARVTWKYDDRGNDIGNAYFGTDGKPILRKDVGVARIAWKYDGRGNEIESDYFGTDGKPILSSEYGVARVTTKYDDHGNRIEMAYFGIDGQPILRRDGGVARFTVKYDDRGNVIEGDFFGLDGQPILSKDWGVARVTLKYDQYGEPVEEDCFGTDGRPIMNTRGYARMVVQYSQAGAQGGYEFYDAQGKLIRRSGE